MLWEECSNAVLTGGPNGGKELGKAFPDYHDDVCVVELNLAENDAGLFDNDCFGGGFKISARMGIAVAAWIVATATIIYGVRVMW